LSPQTQPPPRPCFFEPLGVHPAGGTPFTLTRLILRPSCSPGHRDIIFPRSCVLDFFPTFRPVFQPQHESWRGARAQTFYESCFCARLCRLICFLVFVAPNRFPPPRQYQRHSHPRPCCVAFDPACALTCSFSLEFCSLREFPFVTDLAIPQLLPLSEFLRRGETFTILNTKTKV